MNNQTGIASEGTPERQNIYVDTQAGVTKLVSGQTNGYFTTVNIEPLSFRNWESIEVKASFQNTNDVLVRVYDCSDPLNEIVAPTILEGGKIDISNLSASQYSCIRVRVDLNKSSAIEPVVDSIRVNWVKLPVFLISTNSTPTVLSGDNITTVIRYSVSYSSDSNVIIYSPLPTKNNGGITDYTAGYNQDLNVGFVKASSGGVYTSTGVTVGGVVIPSNTVYWVFANIEAGKSGLVSYTLQTKNGAQNEVKYNVKAVIDSAIGDIKESNVSSSTISSKAYPSISKKPLGAVYLNNQYYVVYEAGFSPVITYQIDIGNAYDRLFRPRGVEDIFAPVVIDNGSDIVTKIKSLCPSSPTISERITEISNGGVLELDEIAETMSITWDFGRGIRSGETKTVTYKINYEGCDSGIATSNIASLQGYNISTIQANARVNTGIDPTPNGTFALGDRVNGSARIAVFADDNKTLTNTFGESTSYLMYARNDGFVRLYDIVMMDMIPDGTTFQTISAPLSYKAKYYYSTNSGYTPATPPVFDYANPLSNGIWSETKPTNNEDITWVIAHMPCLGSKYFSPPIGSICEGVPNEMTVDLQVKIDTPTNVCLQNDITDTARFWAYRKANGVFSDDSDVNIIATPITVYDDKEKSHISPTLGEFSTSSVMVRPSSLKPLQNGSYQITIRNTGKDSSLNTRVEINIPQINVNGIMQYLDITSVSGGIVDYSNLPSKIVVELGTVPVSTSRKINLTTRIPIGAKSASSFTLSAKITGSDDNSCRDLSALVSQTTTINSNPALKVYTDRDVSIVASQGEINYSYTFLNYGDGFSTGTYIVAKIPSKTVFEEAYTTGTNDRGEEFTCLGCKVYFAKSNLNLPQNVTASTPFNSGLINQYFTIGSETVPNSGVWNSPFGEETYYIAYLIDDSTLSTPLFASGRVESAGIKVRNDHNGSEIGDDGSPVGTLIYDYAAVFSNELLQAIGNQVNTTILPDPGLRMSKVSDKSVIHTGETFSWKISYYNDSGNDDTGVNLTDSLPYGIQVIGVYHSWNGVAVANGAPAGETRLDNSSNSNLSITYNADGTSLVALDITGLRGEALHFLEGGEFRLEVNTLSSIPSFSMMQNSVTGCFSNLSNSFCIEDGNSVLVENPDLYVRKLVSNLSPVSGETISYTLIISNEGTHDDSGVVISDKLPKGICYTPNSTFLSTVNYTINESDITGDCFSDDGQTLTWGTLKYLSNADGYLPGNSVDIYLSYKVTVDLSVNPGTNLTNLVEIRGDLVEDLNYPNSDSSEVITPYPDPYIFKSGPLIVYPGDSFEYRLNYGNASREVSPNTYFIDRLPRIESSNRLIKLLKVNTTKGEFVYYHEEMTDNSIPVFDPLNPISNNWTADPTSISNIEFIAVLAGTLAGLEGPREVTVSVQSAYTDDIEIPAGERILNRVNIYTTFTDENLNNNYGEAETRTPGVDLAIEKTGSPEGSFPGIAPGSDISYTINFRNTGTIKACGVFIEETLPAEIEISGLWNDFTVLRLEDRSGNQINPIKVGVADEEIKSNVKITQTNLGDNRYRWELGSTDSTSYIDVCLPPQSNGRFSIYAKIKMGTPNETQITNTVLIGEDSADSEDTLANNVDTSSTYVYLADILINKSGKSCGIDNICGNEDDSATQANPGETIEYKLEYDNAGDIDAEDVEINENIPEGTCYSLGTVEQNQPASTIVEYSNDDGITWGYTPVNGGDGTDCMVSDFRVSFTQGLPSPASFVGESGSYVGSKVNLTNVDGILKIRKNLVPNTDLWDIKNVGIPLTGRYLAVGVWSGSEVLIWGGQSLTAFENTGAKYNPQYDTWTSMTNSQAPTGRIFPTVEWTGEEMIVWGENTLCWRYI